MKNGDWWLPILVGTHVIFLVIGSVLHSPTRDEFAHLGAGIHSWRTGRFDQNLGNPPLLDLVAALPVLIAYPEIEKTDSGGHLELGRLGGNPEQYLWAIIFARLACIPFSVLGGIVCYFWANDLRGRLSARLAIALWCFCPNLLALGQTVTGDMACTATGILAAYALWHWLKSFHTRAAIVAGIMVGLALLSKMIWFIWLGLAPMLWCLWIVSEDTPCYVIRRSAMQLALLLVIAVFGLNLGYQFEQTCQPFPKNRYQQFSESVGWTKTVADNMPIPLPANYLRGLYDVHEVMTRNQPSYLRGKWQERGWWYFYLYGITVKVPLGTLVLATLTLWHFPCGVRWREMLVLLIPAGAIMFFVSSLDGLSHHFRYILPLFPFVFVWLGVAADSLCHTSRYGLSIIVICTVGTTVSSLLQYPHSMSYFNELAGGPRRGHRHLINSSIDWGQDLLFLKRWLRHHPESSPLGLAYFGSLDPRLVGIDYSLPRRPPDLLDTWQDAAVNRSSAPLAGWYAVSVNLVCGKPSMIIDDEGRATDIEQDQYSYFQLLEPVESIGKSIWIYHITDSQVAELRRRFGWEAK